MTQPFKSRRRTRQITVGSVAVGGDAPVSVQTMTKTDTRDVESTVAQIRDVAEIGCDIVRIAVPDSAAADALFEIRRRVDVPLVADIHFDYRLALAAIEAGVDGLRINPGNIGDAGRVREITAAAAGGRIPIRIGVNSGSLEEDLLAKHGEATAEALVESAMRHVRILEDLGHEAIKVSVKASDVARTVEAYRLLAERTDHPLHIGVTEAGTFVRGTVGSSVAIGILLSEGIGDTVRVSLTDTPRREVQVGLAILRSLGQREPGPSVISCPTCGRTEIDLVQLVQGIEAELEKYYREQPDAPRPEVAVMGCMVNGPGEARQADIAVAGGKGKVALYIRGEHVRTISESEIVAELMIEIRNWK